MRNTLGADSTSVYGPEPPEKRMASVPSPGADTAAAAAVQAIIDAPSHDETYRFGRRPTVRAPFPFTEHQFARLLIVRSRLQAAPSVADQAEA
jgi:hypothetical protein